MRGRPAMAGLLAVAGLLLAGCVSHGNAYPNDQRRVTDALFAQGLTVAVASAAEERGLDPADVLAWGSILTLTCETGEPLAEAEKAVLPAIRRAAWKEYPHRLNTLHVLLTTPAGNRSYQYSRDELAAELGPQEFREDDSEPPSDPAGIITAVVLAGLAAAALFLWSARVSRRVRRHAPATQRPAQPAGGSKPPATPVRPPAAPAGTGGAREADPGGEDAPPAGPRPRRQPGKRGEGAPGWRTFEEVRVALIDSWEELAREAPPTPKGRQRALFVDEWLSERSGVALADITAARRARNAAAHTGDEINRATMLRALETITEVRKRLPAPEET